MENYGYWDDRAICEMNQRESKSRDYVLVQNIQEKLKKWHELAPKMTDDEARDLWWNNYFPYHYHYCGPPHPDFEEEWAKRQQPERPERAVESNLYWKQQKPLP